MSYDEFKTRSKAGIVHRRSAKLTAVDTALQEFQKAVTHSLPCEQNGATWPSCADNANDGPLSSAEVIEFCHVAWT